MKPSGLVRGIPIALLPLLLLVSSWTMSRCLAGTTNQSENESMANQIDEFVTAVLKCRPLPALTLAVVKDGQVILTKGYGYNTADRTRNTTSQTRFAVGSLTKAFTALLLAKTAGESKNFTLDTPISRYISDFRLVDDYRSQHTTLRDLLSHRTAILDFVIVEMFGLNPVSTRQEFVRKFQYMRSPFTLREKFTYNNYMYILAGAILERLHNGRTWEELLQEMIFDPLGMTQSGTLQYLKDFSDDFALPCDVVNGTRVDLDPDIFRTYHMFSPAGTIYSNADDMAKWMNFLLTSKPNASLVNSLFEPGMIFNGFAYQEMYKPQSPASLTIPTYGLGWMAGTYRGFKRITHQGDIATHTSEIFLYPDVQAGIFMAVNGPVSDKSDELLTIHYYISDLLLGLTPWVNTTTACHPKRPLDNASPSTDDDNKVAGDADVTAADDDDDDGDAADDVDNYDADADPLDLYVGKYSHRVYGDADIYWNASASQLNLVFGQYGWFYLTPVSKGSFTCTILGGPLSFMNAYSFVLSLTFRFDEKNQITSVAFQLFPDVSFEKVLPPHATSSSNPIHDMRTYFSTCPLTN